MNGVTVAHTDGDLLGHANAEEYEALIVQGSPDRDYHLLRMRQRQAFVELYPDLRIWPAEPLDIRVGRLFHESRTAPTSMVNFKARTYLTFLALTGRLRLDHDWLLSVPHVNVWDMAGRLDLHTLLRAEEELAEQATLLGYHVRSARRSPRRALARLALHGGRHDLRDAGEELHALADALDAHAHRRDLDRFHGSPAQFERQRTMWRSYLHLTHVLLFHAGRVHDDPRVVQQRRTAFVEGPAPMRATVERYLAARRLTDRPMTVRRTEEGLSRFVAWLVARRPECGSFAAVTRDMVLDFMATTNDDCHPRTGRPLSPLTRRGRLQAVGAFFRDGAAWEWEGMPTRPLMTRGTRGRLSSLSESPRALTMARDPLITVSRSSKTDMSTATQ